MTELSFALIGAQKAATTWLYERLRSHPDLAFPGGKRDQEYVGRHWGADADRLSYERRFADASAAFVGDAAVDYMFDPNVAAYLGSHLPSVKVIASLRSPLDRAVSAHGWNVRKGRYPELSINDALTQAVEERVDAFSHEPTVAQRLRQLIERGRYGEQLGRFVNALGPEQVFVVMYDEIAADPEGVVERVVRFIGADPAKIGAPSARRPKRATRSRFLTRLQRVAPDFGPLGRLVELLNEVMPEGRLGEPVETLDDSVRAAVVAELRSDVLALRDVLEELPPANRPELRLDTTWPDYF